MLIDRLYSSALALNTTPYGMVYSGIESHPHKQEAVNPDTPTVVSISEHSAPADFPRDTPCHTDKKLSNQAAIYDLVQRGVDHVEGEEEAGLDQDGLDPGFMICQSILCNHVAMQYPSKREIANRPCPDGLWPQEKVVDPCPRIT